MDMVSLRSLSLSTPDPLLSLNPQCALYVLCPVTTVCAETRDELIGEKSLPGKLLRLSVSLSNKSSLSLSLSVYSLDSDTLRMASYTVNELP